ncbi:MAG TPA: hypothetical protein DDZ44_09975 [Syntrophomonas wolfei]|uniref:ATP-binding protein n=1 Tax=Syntrophomonas wolfei TaxID=863 RepID=A0A354YZW5_9FIRM|nr:hypothetical protein [Syntrophomonas wolfei]
MEITRGVIKGATKVVIYGPEGIGKSTFAAGFPNPLFIDTEDSTKEMDVCRTKKPTSWEMLLSQVNYVRTIPDIYKTLVIDTVDWAEQLCIESVCAKHNQSGIESFNYGTGYVFVKEEFGRFLNLLSEVIDIGINVVLTAHAQIRKFEQPDEKGAYDRYELKLGKKNGSQTSPLIKEWADMVLFANYKTYVVKDEKNKMAKAKATGGARVMYTTHHPCWDAKNRQGLADELPFQYASIAHCITAKDFILEEAPKAETKTETVPPEPEKKPEVAPPIEYNAPKSANEYEELRKTLPAHFSPLIDLMEKDGATMQEVREASTKYFPIATPPENYDPGFVKGVLIAAWPQVFEAINKLRNETPF